MPCTINLKDDSNKEICKNYVGINLLNGMIKVSGRIIINRVKKMNWEGMNRKHLVLLEGISRQNV